MSRSRASKIEAANSELMANGNLDAIGEFFTPDYVADLTRPGFDRRSRCDSKIPRHVSACLFRVAPHQTFKLMVYAQRSADSSHVVENKNEPPTS